MKMPLGIKKHGHYTNPAFKKRKKRRQYTDINKIRNHIWLYSVRIMCTLLIVIIFIQTCTISGRNELKN